MPIERSINIDNKNDFELQNIIEMKKLINLSLIFSLKIKKYYKKISIMKLINLEQK